MTIPEHITDKIAGVLIGLLLAGVCWILANWLWPELRLLVVVIFLVSWILTSIGTSRLRRHEGLVRTSPSGWKSIKTSDFGKHKVSRGESIWGEIATLLWGIIIGLLVAGLVGKAVPDFKWPVFFFVSLVWITAVVASISARRQERTRD
jgi:RsiW-degrading membrane proteinase PrsW (M82 family)